MDLLYEGMSGVNGYAVVFGVNKTWTNIVTSDGIIWNYKLTSDSLLIFINQILLEVF